MWFRFALPRKECCLSILSSNDIFAPYFRRCCLPVCIVWFTCIFVSPNDAMCSGRSYSPSHSYFCWRECEQRAWRAFELRTNDSESYFNIMQIKGLEMCDRQREQIERKSLIDLLGIRSERCDAYTLILYFYDGYVLSRIPLAELE